jgi:DNA invertase Pin-like site-specific DNA recombinase
MGTAAIGRQLEGLARRRRKLAEQQREASSRLAEAVRQARDEGMPVAEIARRAELSRQAVYDFLAER